MFEKVLKKPLAGLKSLLTTLSRYLPYEERRCKDPRKHLKWRAVLGEGSPGCTSAGCPFVGNKAKGESQKGCYKKTKHAKFSEKQLFLTP